MKICLRFYVELVKVVVVPQITTGYNLEDDRCECVALQDYKENEQVKRQWLTTLTHCNLFLGLCHVSCFSLTLTQYHTCCS